jgi:Cu(I)/Ag(I) efflux system membrane protein CusA/SilA
MLQSGIRARFGIKVTGPSQEVVERTSNDLARLLRNVPMVRADSVFAERVLGKPYLDVELERSALARYGLTAKDVLELFEVAVGGRVVGALADGMGRTPVSVRYQRDFRADPDAIARLVIEAPDGKLLQLRDIAQLRTRRGPEMIRSEDGSIINHVLFEARPQYGSLEVVETASAYLQQQVRAGALSLAPGVSYAFAGEYENQLRALRQLSLVVPATLAIIFAILYLQFRSLAFTVIVFGGVFLAWAGGFLMLAAYGTPWFLDFSVLGANVRDLLNIQPYQLTVAVWIGFLSLFGVAVDDGVLVGSYVQQSVAGLVAPTRQAIRDAVLEAARRRIRPALMTTATTLFALVPVLLSRGRGAEIMAPMAVPIFGGMVAALITVLTVPTLYCWIYERRAIGAPGARPSPSRVHSPRGGEGRDGG